MKNEVTIKPGCKVSVVGDSISTYEGYNPEDYLVYYTGSQLKRYGMTDVRDTWWMRVIDALGGELCVNNSYSGSTVSGDAFPSSCCEERCSSLGRSALADGEDVARSADTVPTDGTSPDLILIYMGTNDREFIVDIGFDTPDDLESFYGSYRTMLRRMKKHYPDAVIACGTLPLGKCEGCRTVGYNITWQNPDYNNAIRRAAEEEGCVLCDLESVGERYESPDFAHPTREGHATLADLWLRFLLPLTR